MIKRLLFGVFVFFILSTPTYILSQLLGVDAPSLIGDVNVIYFAVVNGFTTGTVASLMPENE